MTPEALNRILDDARKLAEELIHRPPVPAKAIPHSQGQRPSSTDPLPSRAGGVYLIGQNEREFIWVGKTANLQKTIRNRHMSAGKPSNVKDFRDKLAAREGVKMGWETLTRMQEKCWFVWQEIPNPDMCSLVESLLIAWLRAENQPLLNA